MARVVCQQRCATVLFAGTVAAAVCAVTGAMTSQAVRVTACHCVSLFLGVCLSTLADEDLSALLRQATGIYTLLPEGVVTESYTRGPILGNGEVGVTMGGTPEEQTLYMNRVDFGCRALGGVTIKAGKGAAAESYRYEQDTRTGQVRSRVTISGNPTGMQTWLAAHEPLVVTRLSNIGERPVTYTVQT